MIYEQNVEKLGQFSIWSHALPKYDNLKKITYWRPKT